jgi:flagellar basal-body rod modification protein FlgD
MNIQGFTPAITAPVQAQGASSARAADSSSSSSSASGTDSSSSLQTTFLNLLVTELQNQDPTQPVDPTEMVSQMVSLNQLDQLISINQTLSNLTPSTTSTTDPTSDKATTSQPKQFTPNATEGSTQGTGNPVATATTPYQMAVPSTGSASPAGLMNLYGSYKTQPTSTYMGGR